MKLPEKIDLHMHSTASDGTDSPLEIISNVRKAGIEWFALTDHDTIKGVQTVRKAEQEDPKVMDGLRFINGIEFSCKDEKGKYHMLGYGYDENSEVMKRILDLAHANRIDKAKARLDYIRNEFGFSFSQEDITELFSNESPGKPHIANMMIRYGYVSSIEEAMKNYLNKKKFPNVYIRPEEAIDTILQSGGTPVLAHPTYGDGDQLIVGTDMDERLKRLKDSGLQGLEAYYSGFTPRLTNELLDFAEKYDLFVTAGSDYHGNNKLISLGENNLDSVSSANERVRGFLRHIAGGE